MYPYDAKRIEALRKEALEPSICYDGFYLAFFERWAANAWLGTREARYADAYTAAMGSAEPVIGEL